MATMDGEGTFTTTDPTPTPAVNPETITSVSTAGIWMLFLDLSGLAADDLIELNTLVKIAAAGSELQIYEPDVIRGENWVNSKQKLFPIHWWPTHYTMSWTIHHLEGADALSIPWQRWKA